MSASEVADRPHGNKEEDIRILVKKVIKTNRFMKAPKSNQITFLQQIILSA